MARSLVVKHEETASTTPLLTGFLLFFAVWLLAGAVATATATEPDGTTASP